MDLRQSTAVIVLIGPFLDSTDGVTPETGLTISQADVRLSKNGGNMAQKNQTSACVHDEIGYYTCQLDTTDTNTLGILKVMVSESEALPVWNEFNVMEANAYDSKYGTTLQEVNTTQISGTAQTANDNGADINTILSRIIGTLSAGSHSPQSGDAFARIGVAGAGLTNIDLPDQTIDITGNLLGSVESVTNPVETDSASRTASQADVSNLDVAVSSRSNHSAADIWAVGTRTLTSFGTLIADIWSNISRTLTAGTRDAEIDAIQAVTDVIPDSGAMTSIAKEATVAKEATKFNPTLDTVARVTLVDTTTINTDMRGTDSAITNLTGVATEANQIDIEGKLDFVQSDIDLMQIDISLIRALEAGSWAFINNQWIIYNELGVEVKRYDMTKEGLPNTDSPDARTLV